MPTLTAGDGARRRSLTRGTIGRDPGVLRRRGFWRAVRAPLRDGSAAAEALVLLEYLKADERFREAAAKLRRGQSVYAPTSFAPYLAAVCSARSRRRAGSSWRPTPRAAVRLAAELAVYLEREAGELPARGVLYGADVAPAAHVVGERQQALAALAAGRRRRGRGRGPARALPAARAAAARRCARRRRGDSPSTTVVAAPRRAGLRARGAGARARRVRRARRPRRRLPGARRPAARRVLGRRGRVAAHASPSTRSAPTRQASAADGVRRVRGRHARSRSTAPALHQALADWERDGREEAPDEAFERRAERARPRRRSPAASRRSASSLAAGGLGSAVFNARRDLPRARRLRRRGRDGVPGAEPARAALRAARRGARACSPTRCSSTSCSATSRCSSPPSRPQFGGARPRRAPSATSRAWCGRLPRRSSSSVTPARPSAPPSGCERSAPRCVDAASSWPGAARPAPGSTSSPRRCARASSRPSSSSPSSASARSCARAPRERRFAAALACTSFFDLRPGDYVVHEDHGVARFAGIETRTVAGVTRDYLLLAVPAATTALFVPHDQIGKVSATSAPSGAAPALDKLGGTPWQTVKTRARTAVVEMAGELLSLYAARQADPGLRLPGRRRAHAPPRGAPSPTRRPTTRPRPSTTVKNDMEAPHPMDRLICGDVGYGKTEVAAARRLQGRRGRQADAGAGADDDPRRAALHAPSASASPTSR